MKDRILEFLRAENKSSVRFAEEIGVQPSGISHILSGRNNPSLDFVIKMLDKYKSLSSEWLLFGKGTMYRDSGGMQSLFSESLFDRTEETESESVSSAVPGKLITEAGINDAKQARTQDSGQNGQNKSSIERIVWFYNDGTFIEFYPRTS